MEFPSIGKLQPFVKANCSAPARNLTKSDLGAVVFGCKSHTMKECYFKELFGELKHPAPFHPPYKN